MPSGSTSVTRASRSSPLRAASLMLPAKPFSACVYTKSGATPWSRATADGFSRGTTVTMKRGPASCAAAAALLEGARSGDRRTDVG